MISNLGKKLEEEFKNREKRGIQQGIQQGIQRGLKKGLQQGIQRGKKEGIILTAKNLLKLGMDIELIKQATSLSDEEIINLKKEIEKEKN